MIKNYRDKKGITLVVLVITIIILLILAGITISTLTQNRLFEKAKEAKVKSEEAKELENETLGEYENEIGKHLNGSQRAGNGNKNKLWEFDPEATDANNGETLGTITLSDSIDKYDAIVVTGQMVDIHGKKYATDSTLILKENYHIYTDEECPAFAMQAPTASRYVGFKIGENNKEIIIECVDGSRLVNIYGINF